MQDSNFRNTSVFLNGTATPVSEPYSRTVADEFVMIYGMFLLVFGSCGNVLTVFVIRFYKSMRSTSRLLFFTLACVDQGTLLFAEIRYWTMATFGIDVRNSNAFSCKVHTFFTLTFYNVSVWFLCLISFERVCLTFFPHKLHPFKSTRNVLIVIFGIIILNIVKNGFFFSRNFSNGKCGTTLVGDLKSLAISDYIIGYGLPFFVTLVATSMLLRKIVQQKRQVGVSNSSNASNARLKTTTVMLVAIVTVQIIMGTPGYIFSMLEDIGALNHLQGNVITSIYTSLLTLTITNNAINFYVYVFWATGFRRTFLSLFNKAPLDNEGSIASISMTRARSVVG